MDNMKRLFAGITSLLIIATASAGTAGCASNDPGLSGTSWRLVDYVTESSAISVLDGTAVTLNFNSDATRVTGNGGCNDYFGDCLARGGSITISNLGATKKACADPPGIMTQESQYFTLLAKAERFSADCCGLTIHCSGGALHFVTN
jgi:heat shock protein HslJ